MQNDFVKITNAVYQLLEGLPNSDPLKLKAKEKALIILEKLTLQKADVVEDITVLESYLHLARAQGWIQGMNFLIVAKEYKQIKEGLQSKPKVLTEQPQLKLTVKRIDPEKFTPRQWKILEILKKQQEGQVADFVRQLPKITKRTIRRDLDDLLKRGKIVRIGEWNQVTYRIFDRT